MVSGAGPDRRMMSEINVTPLVDVMLVLLIVFMVTAPMLTTGIDVQLPRAGAAPLGSGDTAVTVTIDRDGFIYVERRRFTLEEFRERAPIIFPEMGGRPVHLRGDGGIAYSAIVSVMAVLKGAGVDRVGLVTEPAADRTVRAR